MPVIVINDDELIPDAEFAAEWDVSTRTLARYERDGLPYAIVGGKKYRPRRRGREWLAENRLRRPNPRRTAA